MDDVTLYDMMRQGLWAAIIASLPILTVALATGLAIGLVQALTSIQELTLTFVPKLAAIAATFWLSMEFMGAAFLDLWRDLIVPLIAQGG
ncbi:flagellar biosynthetic protein FliQ [Albimonas sp. CAU 1670]|uniref:flagellar biosynthetic protein FliQ n=1 Tax=Albimonas sp. CAU 1670 TaxID=3032599 RepID=UPI0023DA12B3|nr:flagellar biosynthetic protein FliQ [Albimonas sp. CAU 1670]MDF2233508.1 flagellar biosynthetic protein FliQ [Albimonas sp. CAU 1670]